MPSAPLRVLAHPLTFLLFTGLFSACSPPADPVFRIGVLALMGGGFTETTGRPTLQAATLFADSVNDAGGVEINGVRHRIEMVRVEHSMQVEEVTTLARRLINLDSIHALVGPQLSAHAIAVGQIAQQSGVPMISPMSSNPLTTRDRPFVFRIAFLDDQQGRVLAEVAGSDLGARSAGILHDRTSAYSRDIAALFETTFRAGGGNVVNLSFPGPETRDFTGHLRELREAGVTVVLLPIQPDLVLPVLSQSREVGLQVRFLGSDTWDIHATAEDPAAEGALTVHQWHFDIETPEAAAYIASYTSRFSEPPRSTAALTTDAFHLLARAVTRAGSLDGAAIRDALAGLPAFRGVSGVTDFNASGDPARSVVVSRIENGATRIHRIVEPAGDVR